MANKRTYHISLLIFSVLIAGCSTKLTKTERDLLMSKTIILGDVYGDIEVNAPETGPVFSRASWIKMEIKNAIKQEGHQVFEDNSETKLLFHFDKCEDQPSYYPTKNLAINMILHAGTFFLWPIGQQVICKGTLAVTNTKNIGNSKTYNSQVDCVFEGHLFLYLSPVRVPSKYGVTDLLSRKLIREYQLDLAKN